MADIPEGFELVDSGIPEGFEIAVPEVEQVEEAPQQQPGFFDIFTGESRNTPEIESLQELGVAPELNEFSLRSLKASFGLLATGDTERLKTVITENIPEATFREDAKGNVIAELPSGDFALNKPGFSPQDLIKGAFDFVAFTPAGRVAAKLPTAATRIAGAGAGAAGTQAAIEQSALGDVGGVDVALAGVLGTGGQALGEAAGAVIRGVKGQIAPEAAEVIKAGEQAGVKVLTTDIIPPKGIVGGLARQFGERVPFVGTSGVRVAQQETREEVAVQLSNSLPRATATDIVESLKAQTSKVKKAAGNRLESVKSNLDEVGVVPVTNTTKAIDDAITRLDKVKIEKDVASIERLQGIKEGSQEAHLFGDLRDARTAVREAADSTDPLVRSQLPSKSKAAFKSIESAITRDLDSFVKDNLGDRGLSRYKAADRVWAQEARTLTKSRLKNVLDKGDVTPEVVDNLLFSKKLSEVELLHNSLTAEGKQAARSSLIARAIEKSSGPDGISVNRLASELAKIKQSTGVFFKGKQKQQLEGLSKLLDATRRAQDAAVVTPTGQSVTAIAFGGAAGSAGLLPTLAAAGSAGGAARIYESAPVRNFLLRLANTPRNSRRFESLINKASPEINALLQTIRQEQ